MPDEKIDEKRPAHAQEEPRTMQQRHVDDAVDDSFPASDPPAWTTTGSQSVAAQCEDTESGDASMPGHEADSERAARPSTADTGQGSQADKPRPRYREASRAIRDPAQEHFLVGLMLAAAVGCVLGLILGRHSARTSYPGQWRPTYDRRSEGQRWADKQARGAGASRWLNPGDEAQPGTPGTGENVCPDCRGSGRLGSSECQTCGGTGKVIEALAGG
jgi:hypothetical protein